MDWRSVRFDWNHARAFLVTAEEGSFSAAARALGSTQPTVGRQVAALEEELGLTLFERVGTRLLLTESGVELLEHSRQMGEAAGRLSLAAVGQSAAIEGEVSLTASEAISAFLLPPVVSQLRRDYPGIRIELVVSNELRDLRRREADIALRNVRPEHPDLFARRLPDAVAGLYAAPDYLARAGPFDRREDLRRSEIFAFDRTEVMIKGLAALGVTLTADQFPIVTGNHLVQWALCRQGAGLCFMMSEVGDADPAVRRVLPDLRLPVPMWLVCHRELRTSRRLRVVFDRLAEALEARAAARGEGAVGPSAGA